MLNGWIIQQWVRCGRKNCRCANDPTKQHGPYWYRIYWKRDGDRYRLAKEYLKPADLDTIRQKMAAWERFKSITQTLNCAGWQHAPRWVGRVITDLQVHGIEAMRDYEFPVDV